MTKHTCNDAFKTALADRAKYPLTQGQYKLTEAMETIRSWRDLVATVADRVRSGGRFDADESLGPCMPVERGSYLKSIPVRLARLIGHKIQPGIAALEGDGVSKADVQRMRARAEADAQILIEACEAARLKLNGGIQHEYRAMKTGSDSLLALLDGAAALAQLRPLTSRI
jgi:hypothetical protein